LYFGLIFGVLGTLALMGCGGGGDEGPPISGETATIQGSVPGTVFVAVDNNTNLEAGRVTATGTPKTFLMVVPTGMQYRFYVMENEGTGNSRVYPMFVGTSNVFELDNTANGQTISLGRVNPDMGTGNATPEFTPPLMKSRGANAVVPPSLAGTAFSMDNVKGTTWGYHTMMTSGTTGWEHGTLSFDGIGVGSMSGIVRNGSPLPDRNTIPFTMSLSGMLLNPRDTTFQCVVSRDLSVMVATFTDTAGGPAMMIGQKRGGTFLTDGSDMTGTWRFQRLAAGGDITTSGWAYGTMGIISGSASFTSMTTNAGVGGGGTFRFSMDATGIMTEALDTSFHGVMSLDKSMIVATDTRGGQPELWVMMRTTQGTAYSGTDMVGDWVMHSVSAGDPGSRDWTFGHSFVDSGGTNTFSQMVGSAGAISPIPAPMTMAMNIATGVMTLPGPGGGTGGGMMGGGMTTATFHGIMNEAKNMMISTYTDAGGGYPFSIQVK
jgi:hypothetical protein